MARAASLGHRLEEIGIDRMIYMSRIVVFAAKQKNLSWRKLKRQHASIALKKRNCKAFNAIIQN